MKSEHKKAWTILPYNQWLHLHNEAKQAGISTERHIFAILSKHIGPGPLLSDPIKRTQVKRYAVLLSLPNTACIEEMASTLSITLSTAMDMIITSIRGVYPSSTLRLARHTDTKVGKRGYYALEADNWEYVNRVAKRLNVTSHTIINDIIANHQA